MDVRKIPNEMVYALVAAHNAEQLAAIASSQHLQAMTDTSRVDFQNPTETAAAISDADADDLASALTLVNSTKLFVNRHFADSVGHDSAVSDAVTATNASDLPTALVLANALKAAYNTHRSESGVHFTNDSGNAVAAANATDQGTLETLLNEMKDDVTAHVALAPAGTYLNVVQA